MFDAFLTAFVQEMASIKKSVYKILLVSVLPLLCFGMVIAIFEGGVLRGLPIAVVDNDNSTLSRKLLFNIQSSPTVDIKYHPTSMKEASSLLRSSEVYAIVVIDNNFMKNVLLQKHPKVSVMLNTQYILIGKILKSSLMSTIMSSSAEVEYVKKLTTLQNPHFVINSISPIKLDIAALFNANQNYFLFLVPPLVFSIWQIFIVVATIVSFGTMFKNTQEKKFFEGGFVKMKILGKLTPYTVIYFLHGVLFLFYMYRFLGWEFQGSFGVVLFSMFLTVVAYEGMALLFFVTGFDYARSLSLGAVYTAPAFAFLGVTFPTISMNSFALFWRDMLPVSYFVELEISQANYGLGISYEITKLLCILAFWIVFIPVFYRFQKRVLV